MNFGEAIDNLVQRIKRPDKVLAAQDAINRAIGLFATSTFFHDLEEITGTLSSSSYVQALDITANPFERFRKIKYIRPTGYRKYVTFRDPSRIFDANGCESLDTWYRAGNYIRFKLSNLQSTAEIGYYQYHPVLVEDADTDWMLEQMWPAIQASALAELHEDIGNYDEADRYNRKWPALLAAYKDDLGDAMSYG